MPRRAPEGLSGFARQGRGREAARFSQGLDAPSKNPVQTRGAQDQRGMGWPFLWILSFGHAQIRRERI